LLINKVGFVREINYAGNALAGCWNITIGMQFKGGYKKGYTYHFDLLEYIKTDRII